MPRKLTTQEFIERAKKVHGENYSYDKVEYINSKTKVKIFCKKCNDYFYQRPNDHLFFHGCPKCVGVKKLTQKDVLMNFNKIHKNKYDYNKFKYKNTTSKSIIICKEHGEFEQNYNNHFYQRQGCPKCGIIKGSNNNIKSIQEFIKNAKKIHGDKYDYNKVIYKRCYNKVKIFCNTCKKYFYQTPSSHLSGYGCKTCGYIKNSKNRTKKLKYFIEKSIIIHGNKYDYSQSNYINSKIKIKIYCKDCQEYFLQKPNSHLQGQGCPNCNFSKGEQKIEKWLKENNVKFKSQKKFKECKNKNPLPFDFYLPDFNICIEYDGKQHFEPIKYFGGVKGLKQTQKRDSIKTNFCKENNIRLIRIPYWEFDVIEHILCNYIII